MKILNNLADNFNTSRAINVLIELINLFNKLTSTVIFVFFFFSLSILYFYLS